MANDNDSHSQCKEIVDRTHRLGILPSMNCECTEWAQLHDLLLQAYGRQNWWPGRENPFEVVVGAILTQRTTWTNASRAVDLLRREGFLTPKAIRQVDLARLEELVHPAGFYHAKAATLKGFCDWIEKAGGLAQLLSQPLASLRPALLSVRGIGEETADAILVYAAGLPSFVVDAYTRRLLGRLGWIVGDESYAEIQSCFTAALPGGVRVFAEAHALIVHHGKTHCRPQPICEGCPLSSLCDFSSQWKEKS